MKGRWVKVAYSGLTDQRLSWQEAGLVAYLQTLPDGTVIDSHRLAAMHREGVASVRAALRRLTALGYLVMESVHGGIRRWRTRHDGPPTGAETAPATGPETAPVTSAVPAPVRPVQDPPTGAETAPVTGSVPAPAHECSFRTLSTKKGLSTKKDQEIERSTPSLASSGEVTNARAREGRVISLRPTQQTNPATTATPSHDRARAILLAWWQGLTPELRPSGTICQELLTQATRLLDDGVAPESVAAGVAEWATDSEYRHPSALPLAVSRVQRKRKVGPVSRWQQERDAQDDRWQQWAARAMAAREAGKP